MNHFLKIRDFNIRDNFFENSARIIKDVRLTIITKPTAYEKIPFNTFDCECIVFTN